MKFIFEVIKRLDLIKFVMCTLVSRDCVPFSKFIEHHVYPGIKGTQDKLNQIQKISFFQPTCQQVSAMSVVSNTIKDDFLLSQKISSKDDFQLSPMVQSHSIFTAPHSVNAVNIPPFRDLYMCKDLI